MQTQPTLIIEAVRTLLILATSFGIAINNEQQAAIIAAVGALVALGSFGLAWLNRSKVYAPATVQAIAEKAAETGVADIGKPPDASPPLPPVNPDPADDFTGEGDAD